MSKRQLILEDGTIFEGTGFGSEKSRTGEVIFQTGMTGYQEVISDPNYHGHIAVMTYPSIGSYGINRDDFETITPFLNGIIVKEICHEPSNFRSEESLDSFLKRADIPGIARIDTRMLTRLLRGNGTMRGVITDWTTDIHPILNKLANEKKQCLVSKTSIVRPYIVPGNGTRIVVVDLGMKQSILHELTNRNCHVTIVPFNYSTEDILRFKPDGVLLSNGPGNPELLTETVDMIQNLLGKTPLFGIGLGHQLFALACGAKTKKMHYGNYGSNFPVKDIETDQTWITTQSRHYYVDEASLENTSLQVTFRSLNDGTVEGVKHNEYPAFSVQFNPEGAPGSNETNYLFTTFLNLIARNSTKNGGQQHA